MNIYNYKHVYIYIYIYIYIHMCIYIYMYIHMYIMLYRITSSTYLCYTLCIEWICHRYVVYITLQQNHISYVYRPAGEGEEGAGSSLRSTGPRRAARIYKCVISNHIIHIIYCIHIMVHCTCVCCIPYIDIDIDIIYYIYISYIYTYTIYIYIYHIYRPASEGEEGAGVVIEIQVLVERAVHPVVPITCLDGLRVGWLAATGDKTKRCRRVSVHPVVPITCENIGRWR